VNLVDPLPQALILTAIVINFAVMGFLLTLLIVTARRTGTINVDDLAAEDRPDGSRTGGDR
jgi:multicomponent Na+:H+ antiporter subunit C